MVLGFNAAVPLGGVAGLNLIKKTRDTQEALLRNSAIAKRDSEYFKENIGSITSGDELVDDPRLLRVALEAYGLGDEFAKKAYIKNILNSDLNDPKSVANRMSDPRWKAFAQAFIKSDITIPGPLNDDFGSKMTARAYGNELGNYVSADVIAKMTKEAEAFRTSMKDITTASQLVNDKDALNFVKKAFGIKDNTSTNSQIVSYLTQVSEYAVDEEGNLKVPPEWKAAREMLTFFDETKAVTADSKTVDKKSNTSVVIEAVISQSFKQALSDATGATAYNKKVTDFKSSVGKYKNVDDFIADKDSIKFIKEAYGISASDNSTDEQIKSYLTSQTENNIPSAWKAIREKLGFHTTEITPATTDLTDFKTKLASYGSVDDLLADTDTLNILKTGYELQFDTADISQIRTYLTSTDDNVVPAEWRDLRDGLGYHNGTAPATTEAIDDFADLYNIATGTRADLTEKISSTNINAITKQHEANKVPYTSDIAKFKRLEIEADYFKTSMKLVASDKDITAVSRTLRFALSTVGLETQSFDSYKALNVLTGKEKLGDSITDQKWKDFRDNFSFSQSDNKLRVEDEGFTDKIIENYVDNSFINAVGEQDNDMKLALYFDKRIQEIVKEPKVDEYGWFSIAGEPPLATVFQTAFNLPSSFGQLDIDKQKEIYESRARSVLGSSSLKALEDPEKREKFIQTFMLKSSAINGSTGAYNPVLTLLGAQ